MRRSACGGFHDDPSLQCVFLVFFFQRIPVWLGAATRVSCWMPKADRSLPGRLRSLVAKPYSFTHQDGSISEWRRVAMARGRVPDCPKDHGKQSWCPPSCWGALENEFKADLDAAMLVDEAQVRRDHPDGGDQGSGPSAPQSAPPQPSALSPAAPDAPSAPDKGPKWLEVATGQGMATGADGMKRCERARCSSQEWCPDSCWKR